MCKKKEKMKQVAINIIEKSFAGKKDKGGNDYISHLKRVSNDASFFFKGVELHEELEIIGLLHDLIEDCPEWNIDHLKAIFKNPTISDAVNRLTKKPNEDYHDYIKNVGLNRFSRAVKIADLKDNMDISRIPKLNEKDIQRIKKYHEAYIFLIKQNQ